MLFKIKKFIPLHSRLLQYNNREEYEMLMRMNPYLLDNREGFTITILKDIPICFLLFSQLNAKCTELHFFASIHLKNLWCKELAKHFDNIIAPLKKTKRRIQATVDSTSSINLRFAKRYGLKEEALLRKYGPNGTDFILLSWINEDFHQ